MLQSSAMSHYESGSCGLRTARLRVWWQVVAASGALRTTQQPLNALNFKLLMPHSQSSTSKQLPRASTTAMARCRGGLKVLGLWFRQRLISDLPSLVMGSERPLFEAELLTWLVDADAAPEPMIGDGWYSFEKHGRSLIECALAELDSQCEGPRD